jgi:SAM-dependent methyltransferase
LASPTRRSTTRPRSTRLQAAATTRKKSSLSAWETLARREPYFAVLTDERFLSDKLTDAARDEFFASGEADVTRLLGDFAPASALDFGCGVGRLTAALAKRCPRVVGVDVSPTMLEHARLNAPSAELVGELPDEEFDFIVSLIVFQHMPVREGMSALRALLARLGEGGGAALHFTLRRRGSGIRRLARTARARLPLVHRVASLVEGDRSGLPYMQMNEYDLEAIRAALALFGCEETAVERTDHGGIEGVIVHARKPSTSS